MAYNGGCVVAMTGKDCVAIATDHRFGVQVSINKLLFVKLTDSEWFNHVLGSDDRHQL